GTRGPPQQHAAGSAGRKAKSGDEGAAARHPGLLRRLLERLGQALAESGMHPLRTLPRAREPGRCRDGGLLLGICPAQPQSPPAKEVGDDLLDAVFRFAVHSSGRTLAAARKARSCMTLIAPTVEFISAATSFKEYPCRKRSSSTRR